MSLGLYDHVVEVVDENIIVPDAQLLAPIGEACLGRTQDVALAGIIGAHGANAQIVAFRKFKLHVTISSRVALRSDHSLGLAHPPVCGDRHLHNETRITKRCIPNVIPEKVTGIWVVFFHRPYSGVANGAQLGPCRCNRIHSAALFKLEHMNGISPERSS